MGASARDQTEENFVVVTDVLVGSAAIVQDPEVIVTEEDEVNNYYFWSYQVGYCIGQGYRREINLLIIRTK